MSWSANTKGHKVTEAQLVNETKKLCRKYGIINYELNSHLEFFKLGKCFHCSRYNIDSDTNSVNAPLVLNNHILKSHTSQKHKTTTEAEEIYKKFQAEVTENNIALTQKCLDDNIEIFRRTLKRGPKPKKHRKHPTKFHCNICNIN